MFALFARTTMDPASLDETQLGHMVAVVRRSPGFAWATWGQDVEHPGDIHTVVLFDTREHAEDFAAGIRDNLPAATVHVAEVIAEA